MKNLSKKVLVYGASGSQAKPVLLKLKQSGYTPVAVTHSEQKSSSFDKTVEVIIANMGDRQRIYEITQGIQAIYMLIPFFLPDPTLGVTYARNIIDATKNAGTVRIVWNASGVIPERPIGNPAIDMRIEIKQYLEASGVPYVILEPSIYTENLLGPWTTPFVQNKNLVTYPLPDDVPVGWISADDVASFAAAALSKPAVVGKSYKLSGQEAYNGLQLAHAFSKALSRSIEYHALSPEDFGAILDSTFGEGAGENAAKEYRRMWNDKSFPITHFDMKMVTEEFGITFTPLTDWIRRYQERFNLKENEVSA